MIDASATRPDIDRNSLDRSVAPSRGERPWLPRRVLISRSARHFEHGLAIVERAVGLGLPVIELPGDRLQLDSFDGTKRSYAEAKSTLAIVVAPPSKLKLQPIAPSADWRVDLAEGCPAHCAYCYLAGSLKGPPITRVYANLDEILAALPDYAGRGAVTSRNIARAHEGTTFEASCYTDPLAIEHLTGSLSRMIGWFGQWQADAQLRFTSKFSAVEPLLDIAHGGRTRMRVSINPTRYARFEAGTAPVAARLHAMRRMADAGYRIGLTIAPILATSGWEADYAELIADVAGVLTGARDPDLTVELITHRVNANSKGVLESWYPGSDLPMDETERVEKRTKFGASKFVYDRDTMRALRTFFETEISRALPRARILYWT